MKYAILTLALVSTLATARSVESYNAEICGYKAEMAGGIAEFANRGIPWKEIERDLQKLSPKMDLTFLRKAYYEYSMLDQAAVKRLTFMECQMELTGK